MSISSTTRKAGPFSCNGATVSFPFAFKVFTSADVRAVLTDPGGAESDLVLGTHYTVSLNPDQDSNPGGSVVTTATYPAGYLVTLTSKLQNLQPVTLTNNGGFYPAVLNDAFDRATIQIQQLSEQVSRSVKVNISSSVTPDQLVDAINTAASDAEAAAAAASTSETNAANYAAAAAAVLQLSWKNKIINGGGQIQQRGPMALSATANTSYCCDRITVQASGGTGLSGNATTAAAVTRSGFYFGAINCSWTSATMKVQTRLPAEVTRPLNGRSMTISGSLTHTIGSTRSCQVVVQKANTADNFSAVTTLGTSSTFSAASGVTTPFSYTLALGASDATNGLLISVEDTAVSTATGKTFALSDFQLEEGAIATPFEVRPVGIELALAQRYYFRMTPGASGAFGVGYANVSGSAVIAAPFPVEMRVPPVALEHTGTASDYLVASVASSQPCDQVPAYTSFTTKWAGFSLFYRSGFFTAGNGASALAANANAFLGWSAEL